MAEIKPFHGLRYNPSRAGDIARLLCPPYDVINPSQQAAYYRTSPYNFVRVELNKKTARDKNHDETYQRAAETLRTWIRNDVMQFDEAPALYIVSQTYRHNNRRVERIGFISLVKIEDESSKKVLPHENTFAHAKADRLKLFLATSAHISPVFGIFEDDRARVRALFKKPCSSRPLYTAAFNGVTHKIWKVTDRDTIATLAHLMKQKRIVIADGHHRYEVARQFRDIMRKKSCPGRAQPYEYMMMYLCDTCPRNLTILPTHRALAVDARFNREDFLCALARYFAVHQAHGKNKFLKEVSTRVPGKIKIGVYLGNARYYVAVLRDKKILPAALEKDRLKNIDVVILHKLIIERVLPSLSCEVKTIHYSHEDAFVYEAVDRKGCDVGFLLRPPPVEIVTAIASKGMKAPHKYTYFYPKIPSGLVVHKF
jgi:uncharacterized protein (DUF1015 family)